MTYTECQAAAGRRLVFCVYIAYICIYLEILWHIFVYYRLPENTDFSLSPLWFGTDIIQFFTKWFQMGVQGLKIRQISFFFSSIIPNFRGQKFGVSVHACKQRPGFRNVFGLKKGPSCRRAYEHTSIWRLCFSSYEIQAIRKNGQLSKFVTKAVTLCCMLLGYKMLYKCLRKYTKIYTNIYKHIQDIYKRYIQDI